jgi:hypothetical protein
MSNIGVTFGWIWWGFMMIISIFNLGFLLVVFKKYHWESVR